MNIAIVSPWAHSEASIGGTERFTIDLATQLQSQGNDVEVFMLSGKSCYIQGIKFTSLDLLGDGKKASEHDLKLHALEDVGDFFYAAWAQYLEATIDISKFDVIQLNSLLFIDAWTSKPRIFTIHTNPYEFTLDWGRERLSCLVGKIKKSLPPMTVLIAPSEYYASYYSKILHRSVLAIPHAIDITRLKNDEVSQHQRRQCQLAGRSVAILLPSRLELVQKHPQTVFHGIAALPHNLRDRITVIATGKDSHYAANAEKLGAIAKKGGFEACFMKFKSMSSAYALADIVALPSKSESFGYSALESLALGLPTILNNIPTFKEIASDNSNAYFFDNTAASFSQTLMELLNNPVSRSVDMHWLQRYDMKRWGNVYGTLARTITEYD